MKRILPALVGTLIAIGALPALAAFSLDVPLVAAFPVAAGSNFRSSTVAKLAWNSTEGHTAEEPATATLLSDGKYL